MKSRYLNVGSPGQNCIFEGDLTKVNEVDAQNVSAYFSAKETNAFFVMLTGV